MKVIMFFIFLFYFSICASAFSGDIVLEWERDRNTYSGETTFSGDFSKTLSAGWEFSLSRNLDSSLDINIFRDNSYLSDSFSISPHYKSGVHSIDSSFTLTKYSFPDTHDYIEKDFSFDYSGQSGDKSLTLSYSGNDYDYLDESDDMNDYFNSLFSVEYYIPSTEYSSHDLIFSYNSQNTKSDDSQDYDSTSASYEYNTKILNLLDFKGDVSFLKQDEKSLDYSDFQEFYHEISLSRSWEKLEISIRDSETYHNNSVSQLYDSTYSLSESELNITVNPNEYLSSYITALSSNERHREFPEENTDSFHLSLYMSLTSGKWNFSISNNLDTLKYPIKDNENSNQNQKSITTLITTSYSIDSSSSAGFDISFSNTKYEWDIESKDICSSFSLSRDF